jgi:hypothetical protein
MIPDSYDRPLWLEDLLRQEKRNDRRFNVIMCLVYGTLICIAAPWFGAALRMMVDGVPYP